MPGFQVARAKAAGAYPLERVYAAASTQYAYGDMVKVLAGTAVQVAATDKGTHIVQSMETPAPLIRPGTMLLSTTAGERLLLIPVYGDDLVLVSSLTGNSAPLLNGAACAANVTATQVLVAGAGANGDYVGGTIYIREFGQQRIITASTNGGAGPYTFTINTPFGSPQQGLNPPAPLIATTGNTAIVTPWSKGQTAVKFSATRPWEGIGALLADASGGTNKIEEVDLARMLVYTSCPNLQ